MESLTDLYERIGGAAFPEEDPKSLAVDAGICLFDVIEGELDGLSSARPADFFRNAPADLQNVVDSPVPSESLLFFVHKAFGKLLNSTCDYAGDEFAPDREEGDAAPVALVAARVFLLPEGDDCGLQPGLWPLGSDVIGRCGARRVP